MELDMVFLGGIFKYSVHVFVFVSVYACVCKWMGGSGKEMLKLATKQFVTVVGKGGQSSGKSILPKLIS